MATKSLVKNSAIYISVEVLNKGLPFFLLPIFTRYMSVSGYGTLSLFVAYVNIVIIFIGLGIQGSINANFFRFKKDELAVYVFNCIYVLTLATLFLLLIIIFINVISSNLIDIPFKWLLIGVSISYFKVVHLIYLALLKMNMKAGEYGQFQFLTSIIDALGSAMLVVWLFKGWEGRAEVMFYVVALSSIYAIYKIRKTGYLTIKVNKTHIDEIVSFGIPLIPHQLSTWLKTGADRFLISKLITTSAVGIFSAGYQLGFGLAIVMQAFNQAYQPILYKELSSELSDVKRSSIVKRTYIIFFCIVVLAVIIAVVLPHLIVYILGEASYSKAKQLIPWFAIASAFQGMYLVVVLIILFSKKTKLLSIISIVSGIIHVLLSILLIKLNGIIGPAQAGIISYGLAFVLTWWLSNRVYPLPWFSFSSELKEKVK